jgi:signal transduction histidine kinase
MDPTAQPIVQHELQAQVANTSNDLVHITEEIYKKNAELAHTNKVLSLLRKIDDIVLSTVTDLAQIGQAVVDAIAKETGYKLVNMMLLNRKDGTMNTLAVSQIESNVQIEHDLRQVFTTIKTPLTVQNVISRAVGEKREQINQSIYEVFEPALLQDQTKALEDVFGVHSLIVYPLIVKSQVIGVIVACRLEDSIEMAVYEKDLLDRLVKVIGIAMDNMLMYKEVEDSNQKLKELGGLKDEFVSVASHELRTPMTIIQGYVWRALNDPEDRLSAKNIERLQKVYASTQRLITLVNDILDVSRIESGAMEFTPQKFDMVVLAKEVKEEILQKIAGRNVTVNVDEGAYMVLADRNKIHEVLLNLVDNATKFLFEKGGAIVVHFAAVGSMLNITVEDNGIGIKKEKIVELFTKFGRLDSSLSPGYRTPGSGLGLYLCKKIVERSSGRIWVESQEGMGSKFTFSLVKA